MSSKNENAVAFKLWVRWKEDEYYNKDGDRDQVLRPQDSVPHWSETMQMDEAVGTDGRKKDREMGYST